MTFADDIAETARNTARTEACKSRVSELVAENVESGRPLPELVEHVVDELTEEFIFENENIRTEVNEATSRLLAASFRLEVSKQIIDELSNYVEDGRAQDLLDDIGDEFDVNE